MRHLTPTTISLLGSLLSAYLVIVHAALFVLPWRGSTILALIATGFLAWRARATVSRASPLSSMTLISMLVISLPVAAYCLSWHWQRVPYDFWLDFPQQTLLYRWGLPTFHPFFEDLPLGGHYGRNLMVASLARCLGSQLIPTEILFTCLVQVLLVCQVVVLFGRETLRQGLCVVLVLLLGLGVGGWAGLLDHFFHHAALAHLFLFTAWAQLEDKQLAAAWPLLGLGLVFPLYLCLLVATWALTSPSKRVLGFLAAVLLLAVLQGGPLRQLVVGIHDGETSAELASQTQVYSIGFPKEELFKIHLQPWPYWRLSLGLSETPLADRQGRLYPREYASIFSTDVLQLHWLPLWLAPVCVFLIPAPKRRWFLFGSIAYLTPALVDFGPVYEAEYYRWELAAGVGFGVCLALAGSRSRWGLCLIALCCYPGLLRLYQCEWDLRIPGSRQWLLHHQSALRWRTGELELCRRLVELAQPGDRVWRDNMPDPDDFRSLQGQAVIVGLTGLHLTGQAFPVDGDFIGQPPARPSLNAKAFWTFLDPAGPREAGVRWVITESAKNLHSIAIPRYASDGVTLWEMLPLKPIRAASFGTKPESLTVYANDTFLWKNWCPEFEGVMKLTWQPAERSATLSDDLTVYQSRHDGLVISAPLTTGHYELHLSTGESIPISVIATTLSQTVASRLSRSDDGALVLSLANRCKGALRLHDVNFSLLPKNAKGHDQNPVSSYFQEVFVIAAGSEVQVRLPGYAGELGDLKLLIEAREETKVLDIL